MKSVIEHMHAFIIIFSADMSLFWDMLSVRRNRIEPPKIVEHMSARTNFKLITLLLTLDS